MKAASVSRLTTNRLSVYLRCLNLLDEAGIKNVSSRELADQFHLNSAQIRKDLANFGEFGVRGVGYYVSDLKRHLINILGLSRQYSAVIVGAGNLGMALSGYRGFNTGGFRIVALFDASRERVASLKRSGQPAYPMSALKRVMKRENVDIAILAVPAPSGQIVLDQVAASGVRAVLNFVPVRLRVPEGVELVTVDLKVQMESLAYHLTRTIGEPSGSVKRGRQRTSAGTARTTRIRRPRAAPRTARR